MKRPQRYDRQRHKPQRGPVRERMVQIEKPIYGGAFLARDEGKALFVPLTLPGEQVRVRIMDEKRGYAIGEVEEIVSRAPQRVAPPCPHFGPCGGCQYQHASYDAQLKLKEAVLRETLERGGVPAPAEIAVLAGEPWGYRNRIRLAIDAAGNPGYRGRRSHAIVPISECPIAAPLLVNAAFAAARIFRRFEPRVRPTEIALFCDAQETALLMSIYVGANVKIKCDDIAGELVQDIPALAGLEVVAESRGEEPPRVIAQWGAGSLSYRAAGFDYRVDHGAFFQVNRWLVDALVDRVTDEHSGALAWDLFAGVGLFARKLTETFDRVVAVESAPPATRALEANLKGTSATAVRSSTLDFLRKSRNEARPGLIVVDPPRTGLGADITALVAEIAAPALAYVSCDPATLARDLRSLRQAGYVIESVALADLFPQTFHLETVVQLRRA